MAKSLQLTRTWYRVIGAIRGIFLLSWEGACHLVAECFVRITYQFSFWIKRSCQLRLRQWKVPSCRWPWRFHDGCWCNLMLYKALTFKQNAWHQRQLIPIDRGVANDDDDDNTTSADAPWRWTLRAARSGAWGRWRGWPRWRGSGSAWTRPCRGDTASCSVCRSAAVTTPTPRGATPAPTGRCTAPPAHSQSYTHILTGCRAWRADVKVSEYIVIFNEIVNTEAMSKHFMHIIFQLAKIIKKIWQRYFMATALLNILFCEFSKDDRWNSLRESALANCNLTYL